MTPFSRRSFLQWSAAGASACAVGLLGGPARAALSGRKVLEIFHRGGMDPWRSFFRSLNNNGLEPDWTAFAPGSSTTPQVGLNAGTLGRTAHPLAGTTLVNRLRVMCLKHDLAPHEAAVPFAMTGTRLGRPLYTGFGTAVNATASDTLASVVIDTGDAVSVGAATALGGFGASFRPLVLRMGDEDFAATVERDIASRTNELKRLLKRSFADRLIPSGANARVRSAGFDAYDSALLRLRNSDDIVSLISGLDLTAPAATDFNQSLPRKAVQAAVDLLAGGTVQYACVIDSGVFTNYDTHNGDVDGGFDAATNQAGNLWGICAKLASLQSELDANQIMVVLNTEFGRLDVDGVTTGSEHWHHGYVNVFMGDTIPSTKTLGSIAATGDDHATIDNPADPALNPLTPYSPADVRAVIAGRMGVTPSSVVELATLADPTLSDADIPAILNNHILRT